MASPLTRGQSLLFVPASRPDRFAKALESGASCVIVDLEDAVAPDYKKSARDQLSDRLVDMSPAQLAHIVVRINGTGTPWHDDDLRMLSEWTTKGIAGVMVPKAETADVLRAASAALGPAAALVPLVESLAGLDAVDELAATAQVVRLAFGHLDFQLDLGMRCTAEEAELAYVRFALVAASRRAQLPPPIDGVTTDTGSRERLLADLRRARAFGFGGKLCIHPTQVAPVNETFVPTPNEIEWARRVMQVAQLHSGEAFSLDGRMVDLPVIRLAEKTLQQADPA